MESFIRSVAGKLYADRGYVSQKLAEILFLFSAMQHPKNIFGQFGIIRFAFHPFLIMQILYV